MTPETTVRFIRKINVSEHCWTWTGATAGEGYGVFWLPGRGMTYAHRIAHEQFVGPIAEGLEVDHLCTNRLCVKPTHLEAVTGDENKRRARERAGLTDHCKKGHPMDPVNTYLNPKGYRACRSCERERNRQYRAQRRMEAAS